MTANNTHTTCFPQHTDFSEADDYPLGFGRVVAVTVANCDVLVRISEV